MSPEVSMGTARSRRSGKLSTISQLCALTLLPLVAGSDSYPTCSGSVSRGGSSGNAVLVPRAYNRAMCTGAPSGTIFQNAAVTIDNPSLDNVQICIAAGTELCGGSSIASVQWTSNTQCAGGKVTYLGSESSITRSVTLPASTSLVCALYYCDNYYYNCPSGSTSSLSIYVAAAGYVPCTTANCASCDYFGACLTCNSGFTLTGSGTSATCSSSSATITASNCPTATPCLLSATSTASIKFANPNSISISGSDYYCSSGNTVSLTSSNTAGATISCGSSGYICGKCSSAGSVCATGGSCSSGKCLGGYCCTSAVSNCASCSSSGACVSCATGYSLSSGACVSGVGPGALCTSSSQCSGSLLCRGGRCCTSAASALGPCETCDSNGYCASCATGLALSGTSTAPTCVISKPAGASCTTDGECASGTCRGGMCCINLPLNAYYCSSCNSAGMCTACQSGYDISSAGTSTASCALSAVTKVGAGLTCTSNAGCESGICRGGKCCYTTTDANCAACSSTGACSACSSSYVLSLATSSAGTCTFSGAQPGVSASVSEDCAVVSYRSNGICCSSWLCDACGGSSGLCTTCDSSLSSSLTPVNGICNNENGVRGVAGTTCTADYHCDSHVCSNGKCTACAAGYGLYNNKCTKLSVIPATSLSSAGQSCMADADCASNTCRMNVCCKAGTDSNCATCSSSDGSGSCVTCQSGYQLDTTTKACKNPGVQPGYYSSNPLVECAVAGRSYNGICCASFLCDTCRTVDGKCNSCDTSLSSGPLPAAGECYVKTILGTGAGGATCSTGGQCMSGSCVNSKCTDCNTGYTLYNGKCTLNALIPTSAPTTSTGGSTSGGTTTTGGTTVVTLPDASATLQYRSMTTKYSWYRQLEGDKDGEAATTIADADAEKASAQRGRELASGTLDPCVLACAQTGLAVSAFTSGSISLKPFLATASAGSTQCTCPTVTGLGSSYSNYLAYGSFVQYSGGSVDFRVSFNPEGYLDLYLNPSGSSTYTVLSYLLMSCAVKSSSSTLASYLCKATVSLTSTGGAFNIPAEYKSLVTASGGDAVIQCYTTCFSTLQAVAVGVDTIVFTPRDRAPSTACECPTFTAQMVSSTLIKASGNFFSFTCTAGTTTPEMKLTVSGQEVAKFQYKVDSCLGPPDFCSPYSSSTTATTGKRSSNYVSDTLTTSVEACTRACVVGGYQISISGTSATLTPITLKPYTGCTCSTIYGTVSGGTISGSGNPSSSGTSVGFTITAPATDQVSMSVTSSSGTALGSVAFASAGCQTSSTNFCGDAPPPAADQKKSSIIGPIIGAVVGVLLVGGAIFLALFLMKKGPFANRGQAGKVQQQDFGSFDPYSKPSAPKPNAPAMLHNNPLAAVGGQGSPRPAPPAYSYGPTSTSV